MFICVLFQLRSRIETSVYTGTKGFVCYLHDLLLVKLALLRELAKLRHVLQEQLCDLVARERFSCLCFERGAQSSNDICR